MLIDNIQLEQCPIKNVVKNDRTVSFEIVCDGVDAGHAWASYALESDRFEGRYSIRLGGKNMTMREAQSGRRIGECPR